jgi:proliferating cell nuclear antigen
VTIEAQKEHVKMSIQSEHGSGSITLNNTIKDNKDDQVTLEVDSPVCLSFALRYLNLFNKASTLSNFVVLSMSDKTPLVVEYRIEKLGALTYYLAPKIDDEDD